MAAEAPYTREAIAELQSPAGGWSKAALLTLGVPWPPPPGWIDTVTTPHRGIVRARRPSRIPCLCGVPLLIDHLIVKRWGVWIHLACYGALRAAKAAAGRVA